jgi:hypothetical protein
MLLSRFVLQYNPAAVFTAVFLVLLFPFALKLLLVLIDDTFGDFCPPCAIVLALEIYGFKWAPAASVPKCMAIGIALLGGAWAAWVLLILLLTLWTLYRTRRARKTEARARKRCQPGKGVRNEWHCRERHARSQSIDTDGEF